MDAVLLSRIQFALAAGFHFLFPPLSIGMALIILILESLYLKTDNEAYKKISGFMVKILALIFTVGVATGIVLEFSFGTNWSEYSRVVGDIFGSPLAAEGILAFFLESIFLGILVFGRERVSKRVYWLSAFLVFFGSHLSALWIIIANSWMQTPAGHEIVNGRAVLRDFFAAAFNPSSPIRYLHVILASWVSGSLFTAGVSAWYLLRDRSRDLFQPLLKISLTVFIISIITLISSGHMHSVQVTRKQPEKMAAFEALWQTQKGAPMSIIGIPVESEKKTYFEISIPKFLSIMAYFDSKAEVKGLNEFSKDERPQVLLPYLTYHFMVGFGMLFLLIAGTGAFLMAIKRIGSARWFLWILLLAIPLPLITNEMGWIAAEVGRQPWAVYKILKTSAAASVVVPAEQILFTLIMFGVIYLLILTVFLLILKKIIRQGPEGSVIKMGAKGV